MKSTRDGFGEQLELSGKKHNNILVLSADLAKATKLDKFQNSFPERFFEIGIAENNMIGIGSGLSEHGYKVFMSSFASFLTGKYDTIRCSISYSNSPCVLVGSHGGLAIGKDGVTQMGLEDISLMRSLPNMIILNPSTYVEAKKITEYICETELKFPHYLRIGRQPVKEIFDENYVFEFGKGKILKTGNMGVVLSSGCILPDVMECLNDVDVTIVNIPTIKPIDKDLILNLLKKHTRFITVEDHSIIGGLGSAVSEILSENFSLKVLKRIGINDIFPESGKPDDLYEKYGLSQNKIRKTILDFLND